ncbi:hypothetical protein ACEPAI_7363 [Sanghuangporus weigelae]
MAPFSTTKRSSDQINTSGVRMGSLDIPIYALVGICIAVAALLGLALWTTMRIMRKRSQARREENRDTLFLTVKGVLKESSYQPMHNEFSRAKLTESVVMPDKAIIRPDATRDEIISYYSDQGKLPRPFAPFSFALSASHLSSSSSSTAAAQDKRVSTQSFSASAARLPPPSPHSRASVQPSLRDSIRESFFGGNGHLRSGSALSGGSRLSVFSTGSSGAGSMTGVQQRQVRQVFTPILPDELTLTLGESVSILRSFDDGWCIVARPKPYSTNGDAELGAAPAWCFVKPMKGLRSERPVRSSSLGVTVQVDNDVQPRNDIISWSNF